MVPYKENQEEKLLLLATEAAKEAGKARERRGETDLRNHSKVLEAFQGEGVSEYHFHGTTGYGYGDAGREKLDQVYARVFCAESGLVREQFTSGTHTLAACLFGLLRPGDELLSVTGTPYNTLHKVIGISGQGRGSLRDWGISYRQVDLLQNGLPDLQGISASVSQHTRVVFLQRSRGYHWRPALSIKAIGQAIAAVKEANPSTICLVDNCYGEFVEDQEPPQAGADLAAGSLIKNPGGGLAPGGGYVVGRRELVEEVAARQVAPGLEHGIGANPQGYRLLFQGLFMAPHVVSEAIQGAEFAAALFQKMGFEVSPTCREKRYDLIQGIRLGNRERLLAFIQGLQGGSPVDSGAVAEPAHLPGYAEQVIMAGGTFIQGSTMELSADAPLQPPYNVYLQGGLSAEYVRLGVLKAAREILKRGLWS